jgi:hypothetical protein
MKPTAHETSTTSDAWSTAADLARAGHRVDLDGVVSHSKATPTLALTCSLGAVFALIGLVWPGIGVVGLLAVVASALQDLDAGHGWVRHLLVKDISHTLVIWPSDRSPGPSPDSAPTLLITAPLEFNVAIPKVSTGWLMMPLVACLVASVGVTGQEFWGSSISTASAGFLLASSVIAWGLAWVGPKNPPGNPARHVLERTLSAFEPDASLRVVWALVGGGLAHHDGIETLLMNNAHRLPQSNTRILCLQPGLGPLAFVYEDGRVRPRTADPLLSAVARKLALPATQTTTAALKAARVGWAGGTLLISGDQMHRATEAVHDFVRHSSHTAAKGEW